MIRSWLGTRLLPCTIRPRHLLDKAGCFMRVVNCAGAVFLLSLSAAFAQGPPAGAPPPGFPPPLPGGPGVFLRTCSSCHANPAPDSRAPGPGVLATFSPDAIVNALTTGSMRTQGEKLSDEDRRNVAEFLTGHAVGSSVPARAGLCPSSTAVFTPGPQSSWNGWGAGVSNARFQERGGLTGAEVPRRSEEHTSELQSQR